MQDLRKYVRRSVWVTVRAGMAGRAERVVAGWWREGEVEVGGG